MGEEKNDNAKSIGIEMPEEHRPSLEEILDKDFEQRSRVWGAQFMRSPASNTSTNTAWRKPGSPFFTPEAMYKMPEDFAYDPEREYFIRRDGLKIPERDVWHHGWDWARTVGKPEPKRKRVATVPIEVTCTVVIDAGMLDEKALAEDLQHVLGKQGCVSITINGYGYDIVVRHVSHMREELRVRSAE